MGIGSFLSGFGSAATKNTFEEKYKVDTLEKDKIHKENMDTIAMLDSISKMPFNMRKIVRPLIKDKEIQTLIDTNDASLQAVIANNALTSDKRIKDIINNMNPQQITEALKEKFKNDGEIVVRAEALKKQKETVTSVQDAIKKWNEAYDGENISEIEKLQSYNRIYELGIGQLDPIDINKAVKESFQKIVEHNYRRIEAMEKVKEPKEYAPSDFATYLPEEVRKALEEEATAVGIKIGKKRISIAVAKTIAEAIKRKTETEDVKVTTGINSMTGEPFETRETKEKRRRLPSFNSKTNSQNNIGIKKSYKYIWSKEGEE